MIKCNKCNLFLLSYIGIKHTNDYIQIFVFLKLFRQVDHICIQAGLQLSLSTIYFYLAYTQA